VIWLKGVACLEVKVVCRKDGMDGIDVIIRYNGNNNV
jgi:hypothetical protein